ncbi:type II CAAX endopeptidase family protein [soil metagenome]
MTSLELRPATRWGLGDVLITLALYLAVTVGTGYLLVTAGLTGAPAVTIGLGAGFLVMGGLPLLISVRRGNGPRRDLGLSIRWSDLWMGVLGGVAALLLGGLVLVLVAVLTGVAPLASPIVDIVAAADPAVLIALTVLTAVVAPLAEEIFSRGLLWSALVKRGVPAGVTLVLTALLFAVLHLEPTRFGYLVVAGLVLGWLRLRTGRLGAPIVAHMTVNALPAVSLFLLG